MKKEDGPPTTLMMGPQDLVDDLKLAITYKYPTTLARQFDPADLQIHLKVPDEPVKKHKPKQSSLNRIVLEQEESNSLNSGSGIATSRLPSLPAASTFGGSIVVLEPDQNIWDILDEYFGGSMHMGEALNIVAAQRQPSMPYRFVDVPDRFNLRPLDFPQGHRISSSMEGGIIPPARGTSPTNVLMNNYHHPKPQHAFQVNANTITKNTSVSPSLSHHRLSPVNGAVNVHKRSHSNPPQLPSMANVNHMTKNNGQAVLLLPKNFTLGEQSHLKRYSLDENMVNKNFPASGHGKSLSDSTNVTSIGVNKEAGDSSSDLEERANATSRKTSQELSRSASGAHELPTEVKPKRSDSGKSAPGTPSKSSNGRDGLAPADVRDAKPTSTFERVLPSLLVLVVEDNAINQAILGAFLRKHKIRYQIAKNGQEAIDKWRKGGFHLVLMDIQLPVKSGIEATKEIRYLEKVNRIGVFAQHELSKLNGQSLKEDEKLDLSVFRSPVIIVALTASSNSSVDRKNALTAGCNDFLTKPVNLVWLQNKITEWGCMQALIDYDGWKVKRSSKGEPAKVAVKKAPGNTKELEKPLTAS